MPGYRVFLGAPSTQSIDDENARMTSTCTTSTDEESDDFSLQWTTVRSDELPDKDKSPTPRSNYDMSAISRNVCSDGEDVDFVIPPATIEAASRRISLLYENAIFQSPADEDSPEWADNDYERSQEWTRNSGEGSLEHQASIILAASQQPELRTETLFTQMDESRSVGPQLDRSISWGSIGSKSVSLATQDLDSQESGGTESFDTSRSSDLSIAHFPAYHFSPHLVIPLSSTITASEGGIQSKYDQKRKISVLVAVLDVEGPDTIRLKKGADAGNEVCVLKLIIGDAEGTIGRITVWRETAEKWSGAPQYRSKSQLVADGVRRGDVVLLENIQPSNDLTTNAQATTSPNLTASPFLSSRLTICYRTMPLSRSDARLRPDLRLSSSDASIRKVNEVVKWFKSMAGLP